MPESAGCAELAPPGIIDIANRAPLSFHFSCLGRRGVHAGEAPIALSNEALPPARC